MVKKRLLSYLEPINQKNTYFSTFFILDYKYINCVNIFDVESRQYTNSDTL